MGYYVYSETSWRFPFQKIRTLFVGIWTEHRILIGTRRVLNLVIEWEGTWLAPTYVHKCTKQTAFEEKFSHFRSRLDMQVSQKMIRVFTVLPLVHNQEQIDCRNSSIQVIVSCFPAYFYFHGYELGIIFYYDCFFSYTSMLFLQAVHNMYFFCWDTYAHICHTLSYLHCLLHCCKIPISGFPKFQSPPSKLFK